MIRRSRTVAAAAVAVACLLPLAACDPGSNGPTSSPSPTVQPSPPETTLERQQRLDFEAAEKSYRAFIAAKNEVALAGGATGATPAMKASAAGPYLEFYVSLFREQKERGDRYTSGTVVGWVRPGAYAPTQLDLSVCEDTSKNKVLDKNGKQISAGGILLRELQIRKVDDAWKIWNGDEKGEAKSCDA